ncbi:aldehyde dehydrogenase family protein [Micromonospora craniellae]|uniref:Aldehyde dehydrogenase family protein n=1 Tax=Micromonospora craniellae TaxID=2294034 RepID=A0A372G3F1_9ACTN|nr:aldehyde dehydrogenase family protein [Micromonospora craniellae]QOC92012.1 aldehyde dehydrogenase family protein [Micromonospora craniellae]RFS47523.1 aldehyde dehydrogenase family protein [Micromonospora craniellae]
MSVVVSASPQNPADAVVSVPAAAAADVAKAAETARAAQPGWAAAPPGERSAALHAAADAVAANAAELVELVVREVGKPVTEARGEAARSVALLRYYAQQVYDPTGAVHDPSGGRGLAYTRRRPRGVAGLITPWNFPLAIPLWKAAPALAFGNAVLLKPAPQATACAMRLAELITPHLSDGLLTVLPGDAEAGQAVVEAGDVVSFTGSALVGAAVGSAAVARGVPVQCEMGGHSPAVVLPDADVESVARQVAYAAFGYAGQKCTATKRIIVVGDPTDFTDALVAAVDALACGDPTAPETVVGPVIEEAARTRVLDAAERGVAAGGRLLTGGRAVGERGWFVAPTVVADLPAEDLLNREEVFGPICALSRVDSAGAALHAANDVRYGLTASVFTADLDVALRFADGLAAGQIKVNAPTAGVDFYLPFGGERDSSFGGREQGKAAQDFYTSLHTVAVAPARS